MEIDNSIWIIGRKLDQIDDPEAVLSNYLPQLECYAKSMSNMGCDSGRDDQLDSARKNCASEILQSWGLFTLSEIGTKELCPKKPMWRRGII